MNRLIHWFYCLPLWQAAGVVVLGTLAYRHLRRALERRKIRFPAAALFGCAVAVILCATLGRTEQGGGVPILIPFYSYYAAFSAGQWELLRECFMNVVLFYPAGLLAWELLPRKRTWLLLLCLAVLSLAIEGVQYRLVLGLAEMDDVIHNTLGAFLGLYTAKRI